MHIVGALSLSPIKDSLLTFHPFFFPKVNRSSGLGWASWISFCALDGAMGGGEEVVVVCVYVCVLIEVDG